jgi:predicted NUDIX family NTP pyrophosphohydrolase
MIPKGGIEPGESPLDAALREFDEELGARPNGIPEPLCTIRQAGGKYVEAFALEGEFDCSRLVSNRFRVEYPPRSGEYRDFPEVDEARWFTLPEARAKILGSQAPLLDALETMLART